MKIKVVDTIYEIMSIQPVTQHVMRIVFSDPIPIAWGNITTYTIGGLEAYTIMGYDTLYKEDGQTIYLSNDGSVYVPPAPHEPVVPQEQYVQTLEEIRETKKAEISYICEQIICAGVDVTLSDGTIEHYRLTKYDQLNLLRKQMELLSGKENIEYHADGRFFRCYSPADMQTIIHTTSQHISYHTTYCNALNMWIEKCQIVDEISKIYYGIDIPEEYRNEVYKTYLLDISDLREAEHGRTGE